MCCAQPQMSPTLTLECNLPASYKYMLQLRSSCHLINHHWNKICKIAKIIVYKCSRYSAEVHRCRGVEQGGALTLRVELLGMRVIEWYGGMGGMG
jgi:hypothetical protein